MTEAEQQDYWRPMDSSLPKDGKWIIVRHQGNYEMYKWVKYKADARRQGYPEGRWQMQVWRNDSSPGAMDFYKWKNSDPPPADGEWQYPIGGKTYA